VTPRRVFARFVVVNVLNTLLYYLLYLLFLLVVPYVAANVLALGIAIVLAYLMNARYAFRVRMTGRSLVSFLVTNLSTMGLRTAVVWLLVEFSVTGERLAPLVAVAVTLPIAFLLTKFVMTQPTGTERGRTASVGAGDPTRTTALASATS
jgi:putative flippase GtrA